MRNNPITRHPQLLNNEYALDSLLHVINDDKGQNGILIQFGNSHKKKKNFQISFHEILLSKVKYGKMRVLLGIINHLSPS